MAFAYYVGTWYLFCERSLEECNFDHLLMSWGRLRKFSGTGGKYDDCDCLVGRREHEEHPWWTNAAWISPTTEIKDDIYKHRSLLTQTLQIKDFYMLSYRYLFIYLQYNILWTLLYRLIGPPDENLIFGSDPAVLSTTNAPRTRH